MGRHNPGSHKGREPADGSTHNIISSRAQNLNFQKSARVGDTPALRCSGGEVGGSPWSDRVDSGSQGSQGQWRQLFPGSGAGNLAESRRSRASYLPCVAISCQPRSSHGAASLGQASKGQKWEETLPGRRSTGLPRGSPSKLKF